MSEKYPDTPGGRQAAIDSTPFMESWESKVDYSGVHIADDDQIRMVTAVVQTAHENPGLYDEEQHQIIQSIANQIKEKM